MLGAAETVDSVGQSVPQFGSRAEELTPDIVSKWAIPEAEKDLLVCNLWQSWYPGAPEREIWEFVKQRLFNQDLFDFVCRELFGLDSNDPAVSTQKLPERHATLRYLHSTRPLSSRG